MIILNNKGMTVVELLASFIIVALIMTTLYATMNNFSDKRVEESAKESIYTYKNLLTKEIYDDIIKKGLIAVDTSKATDDVKTAMSHFGYDICNTGDLYCVDGDKDLCTGSTHINDHAACIRKNNAVLTRVVFTFRDTSQKTLIVAKGTDGDIIAYGVVGRVTDANSDLHIYDLPKYDGAALRVGNVKSVLKYPNYDFEMRFEHPLFSQQYGVFIRAIIGIDSFDN